MARRPGAGRIMSSQNQKLASGDLPPMGAEGSEALLRVIGGDDLFFL